MYPCADGATLLLGWRHILRTANFIDVAQQPIETGLSSKSPPAVRHTGYHPNYFLLGPSIPTSKMLQALASKVPRRSKDLQEPPGPWPVRALQGLAGASKEKASEPLNTRFLGVPSPESGRVRLRFRVQGCASRCTGCKG